MSKFRAINARSVVECKYLDTSVDEFMADDGTKADDDTSNNNVDAISPPDRGVNDIEFAGIDPSDSERDQFSLDTPDTDPVTDQITDISIASAAAFNNASNDAVVPIDSRCEAVARCRAGSGDHRKTVSHIFGRNKAGTRGISDNCWIKWCRKHYQRFTYRDSLAGNWHKHQLGLVREQLDRFEDRTNIQSWKIALRKKEQEKLDIENAAVAAGQITLTAPCSANNNLSNSTGVIPTAASSAPPPAATAVTSAAADSTTPATESSQTSTETAPSSADAALRSASTVNHETDTSVASDATTRVSPNTSNPTSTTPDTPATDLSDTVSTALSDDADDDEFGADATPPQVWERFLLSYLGTTKTFAEVRTVCDAIEREFNTPAFQARDTDKKVFPGVEFLPIFPNTKVKKAKTMISTSTAGATKRKASGTKAAALAPAAPSKRPRLVRGSKF